MNPLSSQPKGSGPLRPCDCAPGDAAASRQRSCGRLEPSPKAFAIRNHSHTPALLPAMVVLSDSDRILLDTVLTTRILELRRRAMLLAHTVSSAQVLTEVNDLVELRDRLWGKAKGDSA